MSDSDHEQKPAAEAFLAQIKQLAEVAAEPGFGEEQESITSLPPLRHELGTAICLLIRAAAKYPSCQMPLAEHILEDVQKIVEEGPRLEAISEILRFLRGGNGNEQ